MLASFAVGVEVEAEDADEAGTPNTELRFQILPSAHSNNFSIDAITGRDTKQNHRAYMHYNVKSRLSSIEMH